MNLFRNITKNTRFSMVMLLIGFIFVRSYAGNSWVSSDIVNINYEYGQLHIQNSNASEIQITNDGGNVFVDSYTNNRVTYILSGFALNGSLTIKSVSDIFLVLNGISLKSANRPALFIDSKVQTNLIAKDGAVNELSDNYALYSLFDNLPYNGVIHTEGQLSIYGTGTLSITSGKKNAIYSKKDLFFDESDLHISGCKQDAIHSNRSIKIKGGNIFAEKIGQDGIDAGKGFIEIDNGCVSININAEKAKAIKADSLVTINGGDISIIANGVATKGIKTKDFIMTGGYINGTINGGILNETGELSFSSFLVCSHDVSISGGDLIVKNCSKGGKCISCDNDFYLENGCLDLQTSGDGGVYTDSSSAQQYYTSKCISADGNGFFRKGKVYCLSTGLGGKGIFISQNSNWGMSAKPDSLLNINIETTSSSIVNNVEDDYRDGCPKAVKTGNECTINSGSFNISTHGMGGEGMEAKTMTINGGHISCATYDDGINVEESIVINGGHISCNAIDNDGIDSNGSLTINGGYIFSSSQNKFNKGYDAENHEFHINGGTVVGLSKRTNDIGTSVQSAFRAGSLDYMSFKKNEKYFVADGDNYISTFICEIEANNFVLLYSSPLLQTDKEYLIKDQDSEIVGWINQRKY